MPTINVQRWSPDHECCIGILVDNGVERTRAEQIVNGGNAYIEIDGQSAAISVMQGLADCGCIVHLIGVSMGLTASGMGRTMARNAPKKPIRRRKR